MDSQEKELVDSVFTLSSDGSFEVTPEVYDSYWKHGYIVIRGLLNEEEVKLVEEGWTSDPYRLEQISRRPADKGDLEELAHWADATSDASGLATRSLKLAGTIEKLIGDEVYQYTAKYLDKLPWSGGFFVWHQDYGYWYFNGNVFPNDMTTAYIAVDDLTMDKGCLQLIPGSHHSGRLDHVKGVDVIQADPVGVEHHKERLGVRNVLLNKGDVIIFHSNILHKTNKNESGRRRLVLTIAINTKRNSPAQGHHFSSYKSMEKVSNSALLEWGKHKTWDDTKVLFNPSLLKAHSKDVNEI